VVPPEHTLEHVRLHTVLGVLNSALLLFRLPLVLYFLRNLLLTVATTWHTVYQLRSLTHHAVWGKFRASQKVRVGLVQIVGLKLRLSEENLQYWVHIARVADVLKACVPRTIEWDQNFTLLYNLWECEV